MWQETKRTLNKIGYSFFLYLCAQSFVLIASALSSFDLQRTALAVLMRGSRYDAGLSSTSDLRRLQIRTRLGILSHNVLSYVLLAK